MKRRAAPRAPSDESASRDGSTSTSGGAPTAIARRLLQRGIDQRVFPAAVAEVGNSTGALWRESLGALTFDAGAAPASTATIFDLASLTKPIATTSVVLQLISDRKMALHQRVSELLPEWSGSDRQEATIQDLLEHCAGLPARLVDAPPRSRREFEHDICAQQLEYAPRTQSIYSDLGFILLGFIAADRGNESIDAQFTRILARLAPLPGADDQLGDLAFGVHRGSPVEIAPTRPLPDDPRRGRVLVGEVHDRYAAAIGGLAGHAGLFGSAPSVGSFARRVLSSARGQADIPVPLCPALVALATRRSIVPKSSRALGWDTMLSTSSCGTQMSPAAFGHVGFTGTSLWIDPVLDRYFVLLTNRVWGNGTVEAMQALRRAFHDALAGL